MSSLTTPTSAPDIDRPAVHPQALRRAVDRVLGAVPLSFSGRRVYDGKTMEAKLVLEIEADEALRPLRRGAQITCVVIGEVADFIIRLKTPFDTTRIWAVNCLLAPSGASSLSIDTDDLGNDELDGEMIELLALDERSEQVGDPAVALEEQRYTWVSTEATVYQWQDER